MKRFRYVLMGLLTAYSGTIGIVFLVLGYNNCWFFILTLPVSILSAYYLNKSDYVK